MLQDTVRIKLEKTKFSDIPVIFIHDTAATMEVIGGILGKYYRELMQFAHNHNLVTAKFTAGITQCRSYG